MPRAAACALGEPDVGDFRIGVRAPRQDERARAGAAEEERVLDDDARLEVGVVGELVRRAHVPRRVDARVRGAQAVVDGHPRARVVGDADRLEAEPLDVGRAADADQDRVHREALERRRRRSRESRAPPALARCARRGSRARGRTPSRASARATSSAASGSSRRRICAALWTRDDLRAEAREGLRELAADRAAADHGEPAGQRGEGEDGLVREIAGLGQAGDGRLGRARAGRDHRLLEAERRARRPSTVSGPEKRAAPRKTSTPRPRKRAAESRRLSPARSRRIRSITAPKSTVGTGRRPARRTRPPRARRRRRARAGSGPSTARSRR